MAELNYVKELTLNFNLRKPSSKRPTNVYAVVKVCGKQIKIPTTAKINAYLWNSKKQLPMMLDSMSDAERDNAKQVLNIILSFQSAFSDYYCYICQNFRIISLKDVRDYFEKMVLSELIVKEKMVKNGVPNVTCRGCYVILQSQKEIILSFRYYNSLFYCTFAAWLWIYKVSSHRS